MPIYISDLREGLKVPEGNTQFGLLITMPRDFSNEVIAVYFISEAREVINVGEATGKKQGEDVLITVATENLSPNRYMVEVGLDDKDLPPIWPQEGERGIIKIFDVQYNN